MLDKIKMAQYNSKVINAMFDTDRRRYDLSELEGKTVANVRVLGKKSKRHYHPYAQINFSDNTYLVISSDRLEGGDILGTAYFNGEEFRRGEISLR